MIILISISLMLIGCWQLYLNYVYARIDPLFQSSFVCFTAAIMIICGSVIAEKQFSLPEPFTIIFPLYILLIYIMIYLGIPKYTYIEACKRIEAETGNKIDYSTERTSSNGFYYCYTTNCCYLFDPITGQYLIDNDF